LFSGIAASLTLPSIMHIASLVLTCLACVGSAVHEEEIESLRAWSAQLSSSLDQMRNAERCADSSSLPALGHQFSIHQDVQRFGRFDMVPVDSGDIQDIAAMLVTEAREVELKYQQLEIMIASLNGNAAEEQKFSDAEVQAMVTRARRVSSKQQDGQVRLVRKVDSEECVEVILVKPLLMYRVPVQAVPQSAKNSSVSSLDMPEITLRQQSLAAIVDDGGLGYNDTLWQNALNAYGHNHSSVVSIWGVMPLSAMFMMPCSGSGPEMPPADAHVSSSHSYLSANIEIGTSCAWYVGQDDVLDSDPGNGLFYFDSCEYGPFTSCPLETQRNVLWLVPISGDFSGSCPARQIPDRTCLGSRPSGSLFMREGARMEDYLEPGTSTKPTQLMVETHISSTSSVYDATLVRLLYELDVQKARFSRVTFFSTTLTQLALIGVHPASAKYQHWGIEFTLAVDSPGLPRLRDGMGRDARVLSVEMMSQGLLWSLKQREMPRDEVYSTESFEFDDLSPSVLADFLLERRDMNYRDMNCQVFARQILDLVFIYGTSPRAVGRYMKEAPEFTLRAHVLGGLAAMVMITYWAPLLWMVARLATHGWGQFQGDGGTAIKMVRAVRLLDEDLRAWEGKGQSYFGERLSFWARLWLVLSFQPLMWMYVYDLGSAVVAKRLGPKGDVVEPLILN
jgi:hypothetical protein